MQVAKRGKRLRITRLPIAESDGRTGSIGAIAGSPLINSTWPGMAFHANMRSAVRHATGWLSPHRGGRPVGRHAGPPRPLFGRRAPR